MLYGPNASLTPISAWTDTGIRQAYTFSAISASYYLLILIGSAMGFTFATKQTYFRSCNLILKEYRSALRQGHVLAVTELLFLLIPHAGVSPLVEANYSQNE
jgi:hypothetical protein